MIADKIEALLADKGYDADAIRDGLAEAGSRPSSRPGATARTPRRTTQRNTRAQPHRATVQQAQELAACRHQMYKTSESYLGFVAIAAVKLWLPFVHEA